MVAFRICPQKTELNLEQAYRCRNPYVRYGSVNFFKSPIYGCESERAEYRPNTPSIKRIENDLSSAFCARQCNSKTRTIVPMINRNDRWTYLSINESHNDTLIKSISITAQKFRCICLRVTVNRKENDPFTFIYQKKFTLQRFFDPKLYLEVN